ncbi:MULTISPECIES: ABC transporter ATP-binding protein [Shouchella]|uniref:ABC transporter ATP-binding protein n=1 Tax=Shouchella hunanensis TaxID=766894 RepID=A0ABY7W736_9BACI|nr:MULTISPECIES: ABC transporter ATP-binding protein [Shouchella]WDF04748.1 ABC transporter ATP-binding protein [Shouchella hunanensis]GAF22040.1 heme transporter analogous to IsdDEF, ATP-binding protein [Bacillus sp. JCM 19047]
MEIHNVSFAYTKQQPFIDKLSGSIRLGKITSIVGPNGSGKSTVLSLLARQLQVQQGYATLYKKKMDSYSLKDWAKQLAIVYQENDVAHDLTIKSLVKYGRFPYQSRFGSWKKEDEQAVEEALVMTGLDAMANKSLLELSGGERQRVWLALSLAQQTPILLLDEPTTYLDLYHQFELLDLIERLKNEQGKTIIMVIHDLNQALQYSDDLWVMKEGVLVAAGNVQEVLTTSLVEDVFCVRARIDKGSELTKPLLIPTGKL